MLQFFRKKGTIKKIMWVLAILIVPAFVLWGSGSAVRGRGAPKYAGKMFGKEISFRQYEQSLRACHNQALLIYGDQLKRIIQFLNLEDQAWERLILLSQAEKEKIKASNQEVVDFIAAFALFQKDGRFDQGRYKMLLDYAFRTNPREFEEQIREALKIDKLRNLVTANVELSDEEIKQAYKDANESALALYIFINPQEFQGQVHPVFEQLQEYYSKHKIEFKKPEQANVQYIALYFDQAAPEVKIDAGEINNYYQEHLDEFTLKDKEESIRPLEEVKAQIEKKLALDKVKQILEDRIWQIAEEIGIEASFADVAQKNGLPVKETGFFGPQQVIPEVGLSYEFLNAAFALKVEEISNVIETPKGYFIIKVKEKKAPYVPSLEEIKSAVEAALIRQESSQLAQEKGREVLAQIKQLFEQQNLSFTQAAEKLSLTVKETEAFSMNGYVSGIGQSQQFTQAAFALEPGRISELITIPNGYCILSLKEIIPVEEEKFLQEKAQFAKDFLTRKKETHFKAWLEILKRKAAMESNIEKTATK